jgi:hypothetical protein
LSAKTFVLADPPAVSDHFRVPVDAFTASRFVAPPKIEVLVPT